jgi:HSP20 family molecular chaperone IbpA
MSTLVTEPTVFNPYFVEGAATPTATSFVPPSRQRQKQRHGWPVPLQATALKLSHVHGEPDKFVVTAATPGIKPENISLELVGNRQLRLRVLEAWKKPRLVSFIRRPRPNLTMPPIPASAAYFAEQVPSTHVEVPLHEPEAATSPSSPGEMKATVDELGTEAAVEETSPSKDTDDQGGPGPGQETASETPQCPAADAAGTSPEEDEEDQVEMVPVLDRTLVLPQLVDDKGITCTYNLGLLHIEIPIVSPSPDPQLDAHVLKLESDLSDAAAQLAALEQQLREQRDKIKAAHAALRTAKAGQRALRDGSSRQVTSLPIVVAPAGSESNDSPPTVGV